MAYLELAPPKQQRAWGWPAVANLTLGGAGAGVYLLGFFIAASGQPLLLESQYVSFQMLALAIVSLGFLSVALEAGRPWRAYRIFSNWRGSWMAVESLTGVIFITMAVISRFFPFFVFIAMAVIAALLLLISQGLMVFRASGVKSWNEKVIPILFLTSGLMAACGFFLLNIRGHLGPSKQVLLVFLTIILLDLAFWLLYLFNRRDQDFKQAIAQLRSPIGLAVIVGIGHIIPLALLIYFFFITGGGHSASASAIFGSMTGLMLIGCGAAQKVGIIMVAGHSCGLVLKIEQEH